ncbi:MAG: hypothetical protein ABIR03_10705, partial [Ginsengibacter sp.]
MQSRTGAAAGFGLDPPFGARQMIGQRAHRRRSLGGCPTRLAAVRDLGFAFEFIKGELELFDLESELLRRLAEGHAAKLGKLVTEGIDQRVTGRESRLELGDPGVFVDDGRGWSRHPGCLA